MIANGWEEADGRFDFYVGGMRLARVYEGDTGSERRRWRVAIYRGREPMSEWSAPFSTCERAKKAVEKQLSPRPAS